VSARLLAIDTTSESGSLALIEGARVVEEVALHAPEGFAHVIFGEIAALLSRHGLALDEIDCFASASGPGSFTGVRVGLTAVKGLAAATGRRVVAVSNLEALASLGKRAWRAPVIDARRGEVYGAVYDAESRCIQREVVMKYDDWVRTLPEGDLEIVRGGMPLGGAIGKIAAAKFASGLGVDPAEIDANYVRRSDAELFWKDAG
jgi:tRNA threonylcarbamoyladenosine biosynthesis protein TsaB